MRRPGGIAAVLLLASGTAAAAAPIALAPHRATYDLSLADSGDGQTVSANGSMVFEVDDHCDAWATEQTLTINSVDRDGRESATKTDYATFESKDGSALDFSMRQFDAGQPGGDLRGHAVIRPDAPGRVTFSEPARTVLSLPPGTLFPMSHTRAILQAAADGKRSLSPILFDGTGTDGAEYTYATILDWGPGAAPPIAALAHMDQGRVHIAFFPLKGSAMTPEYEIGSRYFANGVSDRLDMDFGDYRLRGELRSLVLLPSAKGCRR